ncbi:MAG: creatininase family protein [Firmicutes bacterium]|nr:creatininase family protein [Bacillota bacterium]
MYILNMNSADFAAATKDISTAVIPIGMIEAHGQHCPLGTDMLIPRRFMELLDAELGGKVLIAPEITYGHSWSLAPFAGTLNIPNEVFAEYVYHIGLELKRWGLDKQLFFNGHGGNIPALTTVGERLADQGVTAMLINWWQDFQPEILGVCSSQGHGGEDETSLVLALDENLVDMEQATVNNVRTVAQVFYPGMEAAVLPEGMSGDARQASRTKGEKLYELLLPQVVKLVKSLQTGDLVTK